MRQASWHLVEEKLQFVFIADDNSGALSVTNDAENVVLKCLELYGKRRIIYRDTMGRWDELVHDGRRFAAFAPWKGYTPG